MDRSDSQVHLEKQVLLTQTVAVAERDRDVSANPSRLCRNKRREAFEMLGMLRRSTTGC